MLNYLLQRKFPTLYFHFRYNGWWVNTVMKITLKKCLSRNYLSWNKKHYYVRVEKLILSHFDKDFRFRWLFNNFGIIWYATYFNLKLKVFSEQVCKACFFSCTQKLGSLSIGQVSEASEKFLETEFKAKISVLFYFGFECYGQLSLVM